MLVAALTRIENLLSELTASSPPLGDTFVSAKGVCPALLGKCELYLDLYGER